MTTSLDVAVFPQPSYFNNPYQDLLHRALRERGVRILPPRAPGPIWARRGSADVVHLHWIETLLRSSPPRGRLAEALPARLRAACLADMLRTLRERRIRVVWTVHNLRAHERYFPRLEDRITETVMEHTDAVIVHSPYAEERVRAELGWSGEVHVVPHGHYIGTYPVELRGREEIRRALGIPRDAFVFLIFGKLRPYKQVPEAIEAVRAVDDPSVRLLVAGTPHPAVERPLEEATARDPRIHLHLRDIPDKEVAAFHLAADAALLNYRDVFSSGALLLALSFGLPIVAPHPSTATAIVERPAIEAVTDGDLVGALRRMRAGDAGARGKAALAAAQACSWERVAELTLRAYGVR